VIHGPDLFRKKIVDLSAKEKMVLHLAANNGINPGYGENKANNKTRGERC